MSRTKMLLSFVALNALCACSLLGPFVDRRREAGVDDLTKLYIGRSTPEEPAICYNTWLTDREEAQKLADEECVKQETGTKAEFVKESTFTCRVLIPNHLYFKCVKEEEDKK